MFTSPIEQFTTEKIILYNIINFYLKYVRFVENKTYGSIETKNCKSNKAKI